MSVTPTNCYVFRRRDALFARYLDGLHSVKWKFNSLQRQAEHSNLQSFDLTYKHKPYVTYSIRLQMCAYVNWSQQQLGLKI